MGVLLPHACPARAAALCGCERRLVSVSDLMDLFSLVLPPAFVTTQPALQPAQVFLGLLMMTEGEVVCGRSGEGSCQSLTLQGVGGRGSVQSRCPGLSEMRWEALGPSGCLSSGSLPL